MSNHRIKLIAALSAIACCLGYTTALANDTTSRTQASTYDQPAASSTAWTGASELRMASDSGEAKSMQDCHGMKVTGSDGQELGQIQDFVIDVEAGKVVSAVVASSEADATSGGLRLVPQSSLQWGSGDALTVQMDRQAFDAMPVYSQSDLEKGRISLSSRQGQEIQGASQQTSPSTTPDSLGSTTPGSTAPDTLGSTAAGALTPEPTPSATSSGAVASSATTEPQLVAPTTESQMLIVTPLGSSADVSESQMATQFVLASKLSGKEVKAGDEKVGTIEHVALDLDDGTATAVLKTEAEFAGTEAKFDVPFTKLNVDSTGADTVSTTLSRSDFAQAQSASSSQSSSGSTSAAITSSDESLTATGRTDTATTTPSSDPYSASSGATSATTYPSTSSSTAAGSSTTTIDSTISASSVDTSSPTTASSDTSAASSSYDPDRAQSGSGITATTPTPTTDTDYSSPDTSTSSTPATTTTSTPTTSSSSAASTSTSSSVATDPSTDTSVAGTTSAPPTRTDEDLTATGRETDTGAGRQYSLGSAAAAIRTALDNDQSLAGEDIRVQEAGRKVMLHGKVSTEEAKSQIEALAKSAAGGIEVENKIKVEKPR